MPVGKEKFVFIGDLEGWCYANSDIRAYLAALEIMQVCFFFFFFPILVPVKKFPFWEN